jgi:2-dehydro-3-deoxygluconokinase
VSGITPALSAAAAALTAMGLRAARSAGLTTSLDLNFRAKLWRYGRSAPDVMRGLMEYVDLVIGNEEDVQRALGIDASVEVTSGALEAGPYERLTRQVMDSFPRVSAVAITLRESRSADSNGWSACWRDADGFLSGRRFDILDIVDRVGAGDAFASALICGRAAGLPAAEALDFAIAASCLKHSIPGDFNRVTRAEVQRLVDGDAPGRVSR